MAFNQLFNRTRRRVPQLLDRFGMPADNVPFFDSVQGNLAGGVQSFPGTQRLGPSPQLLDRSGRPADNVPFFDGAGLQEEGAIDPTPRSAPPGPVRSPFSPALQASAPAEGFSRAMPPGPDPFDVPQQSTFDSVIGRLLRGMTFGDRPDEQRRRGIRVGDDLQSALRQLIPEGTMGNASILDIVGLGKELRGQGFQVSGLPAERQLTNLANVLTGRQTFGLDETQPSDPRFSNNRELNARRGNPTRDEGINIAAQGLRKFNFSPAQLRDLFGLLGIPFQEAAPFFGL